MASPFQIRPIQFEGPRYMDWVDLRLKELRTPLGLEFTAEDREADAQHTHIGCFDVDTDTLLGGLITYTYDTSDRVGVYKMRQVVVDPKTRGQGIGRLLVEYLEDWVVAQGGRIMILHARESAVGFYQRLNYRIVGEQFVEVTLPHFQMEKKLGI